MKIVKSDFYDAFHCIAGACDMTCCQEWKVYVDEETEAKWRKVSPPTGTPGYKKCLKQFVTDREGDRVIHLDKNHKCPFLNEEKLCRIVVDYGDKLLSETCRTFPREVHDRGNVIEHVLLTGCPEVVDLLNTQERVTLTKSDVDEDDCVGLVSVRDFFMDLMQNIEFDQELCLKMIFYIAKDMQENLPERASAYLSSCCHEEALAALATAISNVETDQQATLEERNELFLDLSFHYREEGLYTAWLDEAAELAEELSENYEKADLISRYQLFAKACEPYRSLIRKTAAYWIYSDVLSVDGDVESMLVELEWLAIKYATLNQMLFLFWMQHDHKLSYEVVRTYIVLITRMTGYDEDDIYDYLENSFEEFIWDFGYFALII